MKKLIIISAIIITALLAILLYQNKSIIENRLISRSVIDNFEECVAAGNRIMDTYPRQCIVQSGDYFVEDISNAVEKNDLINIDNPQPNQKIESPLTISGQARGHWFFEGDFPIKLYDADNNLVATHFATASGDWMTEDFVSFTSQLEFVAPPTRTGLLILEKDNPSGLAENADQLEIPVVFE